MVDQGISILNQTTAVVQKPSPKQNRANPPVVVDLQPYLQSSHPVLEKRGISGQACQYLGCGYLPERQQGKCSPLNGRLVFQVRGVNQDLKPVVLSHVGRALTEEQSAANGRYWGFPFSKKLEIYNQDKLLLDPGAKKQVEQHGLTLVEGFFDVAALVSAGCLNAGAIMGAHLCEEQVHQLQFLASHINISIVNLFLDRDNAGKEGALKAESLLKQHGFAVRIFDWDQKFERPGCLPVGITSGIKDPADMSGSQLRYLRKTGMI